MRCVSYVRLSKCICCMWLDREPCKVREQWHDSGGIRAFSSQDPLTSHAATLMWSLVAARWSCRDNSWGTTPLICLKCRERHKCQSVASFFPQQQLCVLSKRIYYATHLAAVFIWLFPCKRSLCITKTSYCRAPTEHFCNLFDLTCKMTVQTFKLFFQELFILTRVFISLMSSLSDLSWVGSVVQTFVFG